MAIQIVAICDGCKKETKEGMARYDMPPHWASVVYQGYSFLACSKECLQKALVWGMLINLEKKT